MFKQAPMPIALGPVWQAIDKDNGAISIVWFGKYFFKYSIISSPIVSSLEYAT